MRGLDGLRALAVLGVVLFHSRLAGTEGAFLSSVMQNAVEFGRKLPRSAGTVKHVFDNVVVVTDEAISRVITVWTTGR